MFSLNFGWETGLHFSGYLFRNLGKACAVSFEKTVNVKQKGDIKRSINKFLFSPSVPPATTTLAPEIGEVLFPPFPEKNEFKAV